MDMVQDYSPIRVMNDPPDLDEEGISGNLAFSDEGNMFM